jgi:hypothetical protein
VVAALFVCQVVVVVQPWCLAPPVGGCRGFHC